VTFWGTGVTVTFRHVAGSKTPSNVSRLAIRAIEPFHANIRDV
jgi:hypothetical protein